MSTSRQHDPARTAMVGGIAAPAAAQVKKAGKELKGASTPVGLVCP